VLEFNRLFGNQGLDTKVLNSAILTYLQNHTRPDDDDPEGPQPLWPVAV
jgi:hypothetical protein